MNAPERLYQPTAALWEELHLPSGLPQFLILRVHEMLDETSSEELRPRVMNFRMLMWEFAEVSERAAAHEPSRYSAPVVFDELLQASQRERKLGLPLPAQDEPEMLALSRVLGSGKYLDAAGIARNIMFGGIEHSYLPNIQAAIRQEIEQWQAWMTSTQTKRFPKAKIAGLMETWLTDLLSRGHSPAYLREFLLGCLAGSPTHPFPDRLLGTLRTLPVANREHQVVFRLHGPFEANLDQAGGIELLDAVRAVDQPNDSAWRQRADLLCPESRGTLACITVTARDRWAAVREALALAERFLAIVQFARAGQQYQIDSKALVEVHGDRFEIAMPQQRRPFSHRPSQKAGSTWWQVAHGITQRSQRDARWLESALRHHRLSCTSEAAEGRIVNLWIAFEALFRGDDQAIIERVASNVSRMIAGSYVRYALRGLASTLMRRSHDAQRARLLAAVPELDVPRTMRVKLHPHELALVLASPKEDPRINALYAAVSENELLCFRVTELRDVLEKPKSAADKIDYTRRVIDWQMRRIYRSRNAVVHTGHAPAATEELIRHAQHYLSLIVMQVIHDIGLKENTTLEDVIRQRRLAFEHTATALCGTRPPSFLRLTEPWAWCSPDPNLNLWEESRRGAATTHPATAAPVQAAPAAGVLSAAAPSPEAPAPSPDAAQ